jgi:hypothetical protein
MIAENPREKQPSGGNVPPRAWLGHIPAPRRGPVANLFHSAVRNGSKQPSQVLTHVRNHLIRRQYWGDAPDAEVVFAALDSDPDGASAYAASVIAYEQLSYEARQRVKAERAIHYLKEAMKAKPVTPAQVAYLQKLGYCGDLPQDRAAASALIDALKQGRG